MEKNQQIEILNSFNSQQILNVLMPLKYNLVSAIELISKSNSPTLTSSVALTLTNISIDSVAAINDLIINSNLGKIENDYIVLFKYFSFNSSNKGSNVPIYDIPTSLTNVKKVGFQLLYLQEFILIVNVIEGQNILAPRNYSTNDNSSDVMENLTVIVNIIDRVIANYNL